MSTKAISGAGLRGQSAGSTALCTVGLTGTGLTYRGYDISELADKASSKKSRTCYLRAIYQIKPNLMLILTS